jgi:hypothetical protein
MVQHHLIPPADVRDANFARDMRLWALQTSRELHELVVASRETIALTKAMIAQADRIRWGHGSSPHGRR